MTDAEIAERRKVWRHFLQAAFAEQEAREHCRTCEVRFIRAAEKRLLAEGMRLDAAIDALDDCLSAALPPAARAEEAPV